MKTSNFTLKKLMRQAKAQGFVPTKDQMEQARNTRTKKDRGTL